MNRVARPALSFLAACASLAFASPTFAAPAGVTAAGESPVAAAPVTAKSPLDFTMKDIDGVDVPLSKYKGDVVLIVNTASKCGFTPQYKDLQAIYEKYKGQGLKIIAFPSNDFGHQDPGTNGEIKQFCSLRFHVTFDLFSKIVVKGEGQSPLYAFLTGKETDPKFAGDISWNFNKFLVDRQGNVIARFPSDVTPNSVAVTTPLEAALKAKK